MMGLSDGRKSFPIALAVLIQYRSVTASQPATQPPSQPASHVAVAITLNAKASSLKSVTFDLVSIHVMLSSAGGKAERKTGAFRHNATHVIDELASIRDRISLITDDLQHCREF